MLRNTMKEKISSGIPAYGVCVPFAAPELVEMVAELGFDWVLLDCEHGSLTPESVLPMVLAAERRGITPIVRPESNRAEVMNRYLDRGAMGVQVPHVNTKADAEAAVRACKYFPQGDRGLAGGRMADFGFGEPVAEYVKRANEEVLVCVQIEHEEAVRNLDEILSVEGIDVFFIGPSDLSQSMGFPGQQNHPEVAKVIAATISRIREAGKAPGILGPAETVAMNVERGVLYHYALLPQFLGPYAKKYLSEARVGEITAEIDRHGHNTGIGAAMSAQGLVEAHVC